MFTDGDTAAGILLLGYVKDSILLYSTVSYTVLYCIYIILYSLILSYTLLYSLIPRGAAGSARLGAAARLGARGSARRGRLGAAGPARLDG